MKKMTRLHMTIVYVLILTLIMGLLSGCTGKTPSAGESVSNPGEDNTVIMQADETAKTDDKSKTDETAKTDDESKTDETVIPAVSPALPGSAEPKESAAGIWQGKTATEIVAGMGVGFNLGNTFDATGGKGNSNIYAQETSWGNPQVTYDQIKTVADAGFKTIRIPVTWMNHIDTVNDYKVEKAWLDRVREVVDYAYDCGLTVIINAHHEDWINKKDLATNHESTGKELAALWMQIADFFAEYDQHLIFEVMNEPRCAGTSYEWTGSTSAYKAINALNSIAVNVIRASHKGYNDERAIMIPDYAAQSSSTCMTWWEIPVVDGAEATNIIASVHSYTPYDFCLQDTQVHFDLSNSSHTGQIDSVFREINKHFTAKGIPVVLGETGATNTKDNLAARENWAWYFSKTAAEYGIPVILWDNGSTGKSGGECHAHLNRRKAGAWFYPSIIENFIGGAEGLEWNGTDFSGSADSDKSAKKSSSDMTVATVIWSNTEGLKSTSEWNKDYILNHSKPEFYPDGGEILVVYTGSGEPKLMMDSEVKQQWWMPMDAEWVETADGKNIAHFSVAGALDLIGSYGVDSFDELRDLCVMSTNGSITTYEVKAVK